MHMGVLPASKFTPCVPGVDVCWWKNRGWISWNWSYRWLRAAMWVLGSESGPLREQQLFTSELPLQL